MTDRTAYLVEWTDLRGIAAHLGLSEGTVRRYLKTAGIPAHRIGGRGPWRFDPVEVDAWAKSADSHAA